MKADFLDFRTGLETQPISGYNVAPETRVRLLNRQDDGLHLDPVIWGYLTFWACQAKRPPMINARVEKAATSKMFRGIWKTGRALAMADGWHDWKKDPNDPKRKQLYSIRLKSRDLMFFAAIGQFRPRTQEPREDDGFVIIITAASDAGMIDIHDRRPLALSPDVAREWIDPSIAPERAEEFGQQEGIPADAFEWYPVARAVGSVRNDRPELLHLMPEPLL